MIYKLGEYNYLPANKRNYTRVEFDLDIYYPRINDKSVYKNYENNMVLMKAVDLSAKGIRLSSRVPVKKGDFLSFLMKVDQNPSFWCISEVKWVQKLGEVYIAGCEFYSLTMDQINVIKSYVKKIIQR